MEIKVYENIMKANDQIANQIREILDKNKVYAINFISSPGAGKTTLLEKIIPRLQNEGIRVGIIEGDLASTNDAERLKKFNIPVIQINTGSGCHLDANMIFKPVQDLPLNNIDILLIENVGNLVCPTGFYLGEDVKIGLISVPEGDDKPIKYPLIFNVAKSIILNKIDLIDYTNFNIENFYKYAYQINPDITIFKISALKDIGIDTFIEWLLKLCKK